MSYDAYLPLLQLERRFNPNHGKDGKFASGGGGKALGPGGGSGGGGAVDDSGSVRPSLRNAASTGAIAQVVSEEASALAGEHVAVDFSGASPQIAREHGEGILQGFEKYPAAPLRQVSTYGPGSARTALGTRAGVDAPRAYAVTYQADGPAVHLPKGGVSLGSAIMFNNATSNAPNYRQRLAKSRGEHSVGQHPRGVALHEFGHVVSYRAESAVYARVKKEAKGEEPSSFAMRTISKYAGSNRDELSAEVFADVMLNGSGASSVSQSAFAVIEQKYATYATQGGYRASVPAWLELRRLEVRFNPNHGKGGRFTSGGGKSGPGGGGGGATSGGATKAKSGGGPGTGALRTRASLRQAKTTDAVAAVVSKEASAMAGDHVSVDFSGQDVQIAREHGEGILQGFEKYPKAPVREVTTYGPGSNPRHAAAVSRRAESEGSTAFAITDQAGGPSVRLPGGRSSVGSTIAFNNRTTTDVPKYRKSLALPRQQFAMVRNPKGTALHEFGHAVAYTGYPQQGQHAVNQHVKAKAQKAGTFTGQYVMQKLSYYAATSSAELSAEVFADHMLNGSRALALSKSSMAVMDAMHAGYVSQLYGTRRALADNAELRLMALESRFNPNHGKDGKFAGGGGGHLSPLAASGGMSAEEFDARAGGAAKGSDVGSLTDIEPTDRDVISALKDYAGGVSYEANGQLRELGGDKSRIKDQYVRGVTDGMDRAFEGHTLTRDVVVARGITDTKATFGGREPVAGMEWVDHGFVSTSSKAGASDMFTGVDNDIRGGAEMRILAPRGTPALSNRQLLPFDNEVVLGRGLTYRVVRNNGEDFDGVQHLDVEVLH